MAGCSASSTCFAGSFGEFRRFGALDRPCLFIGFTFNVCCSNEKINFYLHLMSSCIYT